MLGYLTTIFYVLQTDGVLRRRSSASVPVIDTDDMPAACFCYLEQRGPKVRGSRRG